MHMKHTNDDDKLLVSIKYYDGRWHKTVQTCAQAHVDWAMFTSPVSALDGLWHAVSCDNTRQAVVNATKELKNAAGEWHQAVVSALWRM